MLARSNHVGGPNSLELELESGCAFDSISEHDAAQLTYSCTASNQRSELTHMLSAAKE